jgi:hypothetical protein
MEIRLIILVGWIAIMTIGGAVTVGQFVETANKWVELVKEKSGESAK